MSRDFRLALISVVLAIGITTAMDTTGYSALPLLPLTPLFWFLTRLSRRTLNGIFLAVFWRWSTARAAQ